MKRFIDLTIVTAVLVLVVWTVAHLVAVHDSDTNKQLCITYGGTVVEKQNGLYLTCRITHPQP